MLSLRYDSESLTLTQINEFPTFKMSLLCFLSITLQNFAKLLACSSDSQSIFYCDLKLISELYVDMDVSLALII